MSAKNRWKLAIKNAKELNKMSNENNNKEGSPPIPRWRRTADICRWEPQFCVQMLRIPGTHKFSAIKKLIQKASREWLLEFLKEGGLGVLIECLERLSNRLTVTAAMGQLHCVACLRAVTNSQVGLQFITRDLRCTSQLASVLVSSTPTVKLQVFELLCALCMFSKEGHDFALFTMEKFKTEHGYERRFDLILSEMKQATTYEYQSVLLAFVNCVIYSENEVIRRNNIRNEFLMTGLRDILDEMKQTDDDSLQIQLIAFEEHRRSDEGESPIVTHRALLEQLEQKISNLPDYFSFYCLLQELTAKDYINADKRKMWELLNSVAKLESVTDKMVDMTLKKDVGVQTIETRSFIQRGKIFKTQSVYNRKTSLSASLKKQTSCPISNFIPNEVIEKRDYNNDKNSIKSSELETHTPHSKTEQTSTNHTITDYSQNDADSVPSMTQNLYIKSSLSSTPNLDQFETTTDSSVSPLRSQPIPSTSSLIEENSSDYTIPSVNKIGETALSEHVLFMNNEKSTISLSPPSLQNSIIPTDRRILPHSTSHTSLPSAILTNTLFSSTPSSSLSLNIQAPPPLLSTIPPPPPLPSSSPLLLPQLSSTIPPPPPLPSIQPAPPTLPSNIPLPPSLPSTVPPPPPLPSTIPLPPSLPSTVPPPPPLPSTIPPPPPLPSTIPLPPSLPSNVPPPPPLPSISPAPPTLPSNIPLPSSLASTVPPPPPLPSTIPVPPSLPSNVPPPPPLPSTKASSLSSAPPPPPLLINSSASACIPPPPPLLTNLQSNGGIQKSKFEPVLSSCNKFSSTCANNNGKKFNSFPLPNSKMRTINWIKLSNQSIGTGSLWSMIDVPAVPVNFNKLEELFCQKQKTGVVTNAATSIKSQPKIQEVNLLDSRRSLAINIFLKQFKGGRTVIFDTINNRGGLELEKLRGLRKILPDLEDIKLLKNYNGDRENLATAEKFYLELISIPNYALIIDILLQKEECPQTVSELKPKLTLLRDACYGIIDDKNLKQFLAVVLELGNFLNMGSYAGNAFGFKLNTLPKLTEVRANKPRVTFLHYVTSLLQNENKAILSFVERGKSLHSLSRTPFSLIEEEVRTLATKVKTLDSKLCTVNDPTLQSAYSECLGEMKKNANDLNELLETAKLARQQLATYFCEDPAKFVLEECFTLLANFFDKVQQAVTENEQQKKLEEKNEKLEAQRETNKKTIKRSKKINTDNEVCLVDLLMQDIRKGSFSLRRTTNGMRAN